MTEIKVQHILIIVIVVFLLHHFIGKCQCSDGFSVTAARQAPPSLRARAGCGRRMESLLAGTSSASGVVYTVDLSNLNLDPKTYNRIDYLFNRKWLGTKDIGDNSNPITLTHDMIITLGKLKDLNIKRITVIQDHLLGPIEPYDYVIQLTISKDRDPGGWFWNHDEYTLSDMTGDNYAISVWEHGIHEISYNSKNPKLHYLWMEKS
jgi:hypothetical protein